MRFVTYHLNHKASVGVLSPDGTRIVELSHILGQPITDMNDWIDSASSSQIELIRSKLAHIDDQTSIPITEGTLDAPIPYPKRPVFCLGLNYVDHANEIKGLPGAKDDLPKFPVFFMKLAQPALAPFMKIPHYKDLTDKLDYEVELAIVIGKDGINIPKEDVYDHIFGYTIINDLSARNIQRKHIQWFKGKSLDGYCPMGPSLTHKSALKWPLELTLKSFVNDELRQNATTKDLLFDIETIVSTLSQGLTLRKGDIISTGTPSGVGLGFDPPKFLVPGDVVRCEIEGIGVLENQLDTE